MLGMVCILSVLQLERELERSLLSAWVIVASGVVRSTSNRPSVHPKLLKARHECSHRITLLMFRYSFLPAIVALTRERAWNCAPDCLQLLDSHAFSLLWLEGIRWRNVTFLYSSHGYIIM
jgi:hypothetical protein